MKRFPDGPRGRSTRRLVTGLAVALLSAFSVAANTRWNAPPRFDGAGYAVLAESLTTGQGYREIASPLAPRHAHFPPGYPAALALLWTATGRSVAAAHLLACACTIAATVFAWLWFHRLFPARTADLLGLALAANWTWGRIGGSIQSEPFYLLISLLAVHALTGTAARGGTARAIVAGLLVGATILTRHVGAMMLVAGVIDLVTRRRWREALTTGFLATIVVLPWALWLVRVGHGTQPELLLRESLAALIRSQSLFYLQRIPDQLTGPLVEIGTVFKRSAALTIAVNVWAVLATGLVVFGWLRALRRPRRRLSGLVAFSSLGLLLVWPFTEAGRFLIPLVPFILAGAVQGLGEVILRFPLVVSPRLSPHSLPISNGRSGGSPNAPLHTRPIKRTSRRQASDWAAGVILALALPYSVYAIATGRAEAQRGTYREFDSACAWIAREATQPGPILARHPGEVFWLSRRQAVVPSSDDPAELERLIDEFGVAYLLVDDDRYVNAKTSVLSRYVISFPDRVRRVGTWAGVERSVSVYEIVRGR